MELKEKCAYIKGLMEGLELDTTTKEGKVINAMMELLTELTSTVTALDDEMDQGYDELDAIDEDTHGIFIEAMQIGYIQTNARS